MMLNTLNTLNTFRKYGFAIKRGDEIIRLTNAEMLAFSRLDSASKVLSNYLEEAGQAATLAINEMMADEMACEDLQYVLVDCYSKTIEEYVDEKIRERVTEAIQNTPDAEPHASENSFIKAVIAEYEDLCEDVGEEYSESQAVADAIECTIQTWNRMAEVMSEKE